MLNREPMWLKCNTVRARTNNNANVSVLNREPMWLKSLDEPPSRLVEDEFQCSTVSRCG